jgi:uncharacterized protein (TIRG00374 family)
VVGVAIGAAVIAISHPDRIWASLQQADLMLVLAALALNVPVIWLRSLRAQIIVRHLGYRVPMRSMVPVQLVGQTSSTITPAASGDYVRAYLWRSAYGVPVRVGAAVVTFERLYSLFLMVAVSVLLILFPRHGVIGWIIVGIGLAMATFAPLLFELMPTSLERWVLAKLGRGRFMGRFQEGATVMVDQFRNLMKAPLLLGWTSALTLVNFIAMGAQLWLVMLSLAHRVPITQAVAANSTSQVAGIISTLPFGIGSQDAILVTVFAGYGVTVSLAASAAVLMRATTTIPLALAGLAAYLLVDKPATQSAMEVE